MHQRQQLQKDARSTIFARYCTESLLPFGTVKQRLQTYQGRSFEELQDNLHEIVGSIG
jgi:hypothetical protein